MFTRLLTTVLLVLALLFIPASASPGDPGKLNATEIINTDPSMTNVAFCGFGEVFRIYYKQGEDPYYMVYFDPQTTFAILIELKEDGEAISAVFGKIDASNDTIKFITTEVLPIDKVIEKYASPCDYLAQGYEKPA